LLAKLCDAQPYSSCPPNKNMSHLHVYPSMDIFMPPLSVPSTQILVTGKSCHNA